MTKETVSAKIYKSSLPDIPIFRQSILTHIFARANVSLETPAFIDAPTGTTLSRGRVRYLMMRLAWGLRHIVRLPDSSSAGLTNLKRGDTIMVLSPNSLSWPIAVFGAVAAGLRTTFASSSATPEELKWQWTDSKARMIVVSPSHVHVVRNMFILAGISETEVQKRIWVMDRLWEFHDSKEQNTEHNKLIDLMNSGSMEEEENFDGDRSEETVFICYSSGTTGLPKGVETTHKNMCATLGMMEVAYRPILTKKDVVLSVLPFYHMYGLAMHVHFQIYTGIPLVIMPQAFDPEILCKAIESYKVTTLMVAPPMLLSLSTHPAVDLYRMDSLTSIISGAAPLSSVLAYTVSKRLKSRGANVALMQGCGSTEVTCTAQMVLPCDHERKLGSIGILLSSLEARIVQEVEGSEEVVDVEDGEPGELWLRGPTVMKGYLNNAKATASSITPDLWYKTGDVMRRDQEGYYYIVDRKKELIKYKGYQVAPAELEAALLENAEVGDVGVIGILDEYSGNELPRAYVVPSEPDILKSKVDKIAYEIRVRKWLEGRVAHYKYLRGGVIALDAIPKSPTGKILRKLLRERAKTERIPKSAPSKL